MISKELFEAVFEGCNFGKYSNEEEVIYYCQPCNIISGSWVNSEVSIFQFYFECKEWALSKGYVLVSWYENEKGYVRITKSGFSSIGLLNSDTEVEAVIKACEWIYKELSK